MAEQQKISKEILENKIGNEFEVLVESKSFDSKYFIGRTMQDVPEIDGIVYIKNTGKENLLNKFVKCKITDVNNYDLMAEVV